MARRGVVRRRTGDAPAAGDGAPCAICREEMVRRGGGAVRAAPVRSPVPLALRAPVAGAAEHLPLLPRGLPAEDARARPGGCGGRWRGWQPETTASAVRDNVGWRRAWHKGETRLDAFECLGLQAQVLVSDSRMAKLAVDPWCIHAI